MRKAVSNRRVFLKKSAAFTTGLMALGWLAPNNLQAKPLVKLPKRIVFIGDSITMAGDYINFFEFYIRLRYPKWQGEILNMGLSSETASGLSEPAHPYPRPYIHNRLRNVLKTTAPDLVFVCYGMNCGIYHPFAKERFDAYKAGILGIINQVQTIGAQLVLLTPPPFAHKGRPKMDLETGETYSYAKPFEAYDQVLKGYGTWLQGQFAKEFPVIDLHAAISPFKEICYGKDIIHPNEYGHFLMAHAILEGLELQQKQTLKIKVKPSNIDAKEYFSVDFAPIMSELLFTKPMKELGFALANFNALDLKLRGLSSGTEYDLALGEEVKLQNTGRAWKRGISLANELGKVSLSAHPELMELWQIIKEKRRVYDRALLNKIGHNRPGVESIPFEEAQELKGALDKKLQALKIKSTISGSIISV